MDSPWVIPRLSQTLISAIPINVRLEAWAQGFCVGALIIMAGITVSNMRRGVLLHKLILIEVREAGSNRQHEPLSPSPAHLWHAAQYVHLP